MHYTNALNYQHIYWNFKSINHSIKVKGRWCEHIIFYICKNKAFLFSIKGGWWSPLNNPSRVRNTARAGHNSTSFYWPQVVFVIEELDGAQRCPVHRHLIPILCCLLLHALQTEKIFLGGIILKSWLCHMCGTVYITVKYSHKNFKTVLKTSLYLKKSFT